MRSRAVGLGGVTGSTGVGGLKRRVGVGWWKDAGKQNWWWMNMEQWVRGEEWELVGGGEDWSNVFPSVNQH
jgi:hypothetical protein